MLNERFWDRVKVAVPLQPFDRGDLLTLMRRRLGHAGQNAAAFDMDSACPAFDAIP
jgi:hypothetical protein